MDKKNYLSLSVSEQALLSAAAQILSGFVASTRYGSSPMDELEEKSFRLALALAARVEKEVAADGELP